MLFYKIHSKVHFEHFHYGQESIAMIPMADSLNHSNFGAYGQMICLGLHPDGDKHPDYYRIEKYMADYSEVFRANGWSQ